MRKVERTTRTKNSDCILSGTFFTDLSCRLRFDSILCPSVSRAMRVCTAVLPTQLSHDGGCPTEGKASARFEPSLVL